MKQILIKILMVCAFGSLITAQTSFSGNISSNTTWSASGSPYNLTGNVGVPSGYTLTIDAGVTVNFTGDYQILVLGGLIINGTSSSKVLINSSSDAYTKMIMFKKTDLSNSSISHTNFVGPQGSIQLASEGEHNEDDIKISDTLRVQYSNFSNTYVSTGDYSTTAGLIISNSTFSSSGIQGGTRNAPIILKSCTIESSELNSSNYHKGITMQSTTLLNSTMQMGCCGGNYDFQNSIVYNTPTTSCCGSPVSGDYKIINSKFINSPVSLGNAALTITNSVITDTSDNVIYLGNGTITNSSFGIHGSELLGSQVSDFSSMQHLFGSRLRLLY